MSGPVEIVLIIAAVGYVLIRRLLGEPAEARRMLVLPAVLCVIGLCDVVKVHQSSLAMAFLVVTTAVSVVIGLLRGASIRVFERDGITHMRYTATTVVLLATSIAIKLGASAVLGVVQPSAAHSSSNSLMLTLGTGLLAEGLVVLSKAVRTGAPIVWSKGKDGEPHTTSPLLDGLQQRVRSDDSRPYGNVRVHH